MNLPHLRVDRHVFSHSLRIFAALLGMTGAGMAQAVAEPAKEQAGIYDSRAIAVAYAGSALHGKQLQPLMAAMKQAKEDGDTKKIAELEATGKARQARLHQQAFSTASVADILALMPEAVSKIKTDAGLTVMVSKWDIEELKKYPKEQQVDVTMPLVDALKPGAKQRKAAIEIQTKQPVEADGIRNIKP